MEGILDVLERPDFLGLLGTHVELSVIALLLGAAIALPVAVAVRNTPVGAALAVNVGNIGRAVTSLAILALALPFLGYGFEPALVALTALAIPPILINASRGGVPCDNHGGGFQRGREGSHAQGCEDRSKEARLERTRGGQGEEQDEVDPRRPDGARAAVARGLRQRRQQRRFGVRRRWRTDDHRRLEELHR